jgi:EmrB/QacA subfamily drug resistance transporter
MTVLDSNIVAVVLPTIARDFGASFADTEWVISAYVLCFASLLLPAGAIADRFGRRRLFLCGIAGFAVASFLCGSASTAAALCFFRALQGAGAAFMLAPALAIIAHTFQDEHGRDRAWSFWGGIMGLTMVLAPITGGVISFALGWRWAFYVNVPICLVLASGAWSFLEDSRDVAARGLDPAGIALFAITMFAMTWGLINGQAHGWGSVSAVAGFVVGVVALAAFIVAERAQVRPMLDLSLFTNPRLIGSVWAMFAYAACAQVMTNMLPPFFQNGFGLGALGAGVAMLPFALAMLILPFAGRALSKHLRSADILAMGLALVGCGNAAAAWGAATGNWTFVVLGMLVLGSGGGLLNGETQKAIMSDVSLGRAGMASGISTTARFSGILLGYALLSGVVATATRLQIEKHVIDGPLARRLADAVVAGNSHTIIAQMPKLGPERALRTAHAIYATGFSTALLFAAVTALVSSLAVWKLSRASNPSALRDRLV